MNRGESFRRNIKNGKFKNTSKSTIKRSELHNVVMMYFNISKGLLICARLPRHLSYLWSPLVVIQYYQNLDRLHIRK